MKRCSPIVFAVVFPGVFLFALTARPARLYAESATAPQCSSAVFASCEGKAPGASCGEEATCQSTRCYAEAEAGAASFTKELSCVRAASKDASVINPITPAESGDTEPDEGCNVGGGGAATGSGAGFGLLMALAAFARRARLARRWQGLN